MNQTSKHLYDNGLPYITVKENGVVHIFYPKGIKITAKHFDRAVRHVSQLPNGPHLIIVEGDRGNPFDREMRAIATREDTVASAKAIAFVTANSLGRFLIQTFNSLVKQQIIVNTFASTHEAEQWLLTGPAENMPAEHLDTCPDAIQERQYEDMATFVGLVAHHHDSLEQKLASLKDRLKMGTINFNPLEMSFLRQEMMALNTSWLSVKEKYQKLDPPADLIELMRRLDTDISDLRVKIEDISLYIEGR